MEAVLAHCKIKLNINNIAWDLNIEQQQYATDMQYAICNRFLTENAPEIKNNIKLRYFPSLYRSSLYRFSEFIMAERMTWGMQIDKYSA